VMECEILYQDEFIIAINKPYGYFVHKSSLDATSSKILMKILRNQIGQYVYPVHRLDRKTTGVLLFALSKEVLAIVNKSFEDRQTEKEYIAICRGFMPDKGTINYPLINEKDGKSQDAVTNYEVLQKSEINLASGKFLTSRYSLVKFIPITGRMHQIRKHAAHIFHPIIADRPHGCNKQNKLLLEHFNFLEMALHAKSLTLDHPVTNQRLTIQADFSQEFQRISQIMNFDLEGILF
jgi:tRNA pseudouridine65 synthase